MTKQSHAIETYKLTYELMKSFVKTPSIHPDVKRDAKFFVQLLDDCQVYELDPKITHFALNQEPLDFDAPVSHECASPADKLLVSTSYGSGFFIEKDNDTYYLYTIQSECWLQIAMEDSEQPDVTPMTLIASYKLGEQVHLTHKDEKGKPTFSTFTNLNKENIKIFENAWALIESYLMILRVINSPRLTEKKPAGTRQQRRSEARGMGKAVDAWHRVSWNIDKPSVAKEPYDQGFHKMPLHFNRGHWKRAEKHHPKSRQRPNALRPEHRTGWWTWIDGYFAGHPAFGFKKQYHRPQITKVA
tara:strand:+ start:43 stop:945 length:903 start_codon:yes stop_codon:yes gene_type:complete